MSNFIEIDGEKLSWSDFSEAFSCVLEADYAGRDDEMDASVDLVRSAFDAIVVLQVYRECFSGDEVDYFGLGRSDKSEVVVAFWVTNCGASDVFPISSGESLCMILDDMLSSLGWRLPQVSGVEIWNRRPDMLSKDEVRQLIVEIEKRGVGDFTWESVGEGKIASAEEFMRRHYSE